MKDLRRLALLILSDLADMEPETLEKSMTGMKTFEHRLEQVEARLKKELSSKHQI